MVTLAKRERGQIRYVTGHSDGTLDKLGQRGGGEEEKEEEEEEEEEDVSFYIPPRRNTVKSAFLAFRLTRRFRNMTNGIDRVRKSVTILITAMLILKISVRMHLALGPAVQRDAMG